MDGMRTEGWFNSDLKDAEFKCWRYTPDGERIELGAAASMERLFRTQEADAEYYDSLRRLEAQLKTRKRARVLDGPARAMRQYRNAIRKLGLMAVAEALGA